MFCSLVKQHRDEVQGEERSLPNRAAEGTVGAELGDCFMMIGREEGKLRPWSLSLMSFMAIENSSLSILPSLSVSARRLHEEEEEGKTGSDHFYTRFQQKSEHTPTVLIQQHTLFPLQCTLAMGGWDEPWRELVLNRKHKAGSTKYDLFLVTLSG